MLGLSDMRQTHQQYLVDLEIKFSDKSLSAAELTTLCLLPELAKSKIEFQRAPLFKTKIETSPIIEFLRNYSWKGKTDRIRRSLVQWHLGHYPLVLSDQIPTPLALLQIQANGKRVITVFKNSSDWQRTHLGKSAWEFIVHDLIHADHFFENSEWREGQIAFYQFILKNWDHKMVSCVRSHCSEQFDYLISDMNSHPQHMYQTLAALCLLAWKNKLELDPKTRLPEEQELLFQEQKNHLLGALLLK